MTISPAEQKFYDTYVVELRSEIAKHPGEYGYPVLRADDVAMKMTIALKNGTANKNSNAVRRTCRKLGIPYTYTGIKFFLKGEIQ